MCACVWAGFGNTFRNVFDVSETRFVIFVLSWKHILWRLQCLGNTFRDICGVSETCFETFAISETHFVTFPMSVVCDVCGVAGTRFAMFTMSREHFVWHLQCLGNMFRDVSHVSETHFVTCAVSPKQFVMFAVSWKHVLWHLRCLGNTFCDICAVSKTHCVACAVSKIWLFFGCDTKTNIDPKLHDCDAIVAKFWRLFVLVWLGRCFLANHTHWI